MTRYGKITAGNVEMNTREVMPPDFNSSLTKYYGILFRVYGGPNSQMTSKKWEMDWSHAVASDPEMRMIVVYVWFATTNYY